MELLCTQCRGIGPHLSEKGKSHFFFFSSCSGNLGYILELRQGWPFKTRVCSATSGLLSSYDGHLRNLNYAWQDNIDTSRGEVGDQGSFSSWHSDIGLPINFQDESGNVTF